MFEFIRAVLVGFALGYLAAIIQDSLPYRGSGKYRRGLNDCRNCKNMICITWNWEVECKRYGSKLSGEPKCCAMYERIEETGKES